MMLHGWCSRCKRVRRVRVTTLGVLSVYAQGVVVGVCSECEGK